MFWKAALWLAVLVGLLVVFSAVVPSVGVFVAANQGAVYLLTLMMALSFSKVFDSKKAGRS